MVTMIVIVKAPTVIVTAEDMDTETGLMVPRLWELSVLRLQY